VILLQIISTVFTKCKKDSEVPAPTANFIYSGQGLALSAVTFTNSSVNATSYFWDFGDGNNSILPNPSHTYLKGGIFTVTLTAYSGNVLNTFSQSVLISSPTKVTITKVELATLTSMPSGSFQAFLEINDGTNVIWTDGYYNLNSSTVPVDLLINTPYTITNFSQVLYL
jgi:PKD repeat protein